jgi:hypothetical protein
MSERERMEHVFRRMGEPSWHILRVLSLSEALPGFEIINRVESLLRSVNFPYHRLDPSTLHHALKRMMDDGLVRCPGDREVEVPGPRGTTRRASRAVYLLTGFGAAVRARKAELDTELADRVLAPPAPAGA